MYRCFILQPPAFPHLLPAIAVARLLAQTLSNIVTANDELMSKLWETYMKLPEDQVILMYGLFDLQCSVSDIVCQNSRLLQSPDPGILLTVLVFILNSIHGSRKRRQVVLMRDVAVTIIPYYSTLMSRTTVGIRVCITLLDDMLKLFEAEELTQEAQAFDVGWVFSHFHPPLTRAATIPRYEILTQLIEQALVPDLYAKFAM